MVLAATFETLIKQVNLLETLVVLYLVPGMIWSRLMYMYEYIYSICVYEFQVGTVNRNIFFFGNRNLH